VVAGHSLGEYTALVCAGALEFGAAAKLVNLRGKYMQQAVADGDGAIAAVLGLDDETVRECCAAAAGVVTPANYNAPGQVAIAGTQEAVQQALERCKAAGAKRAVLLNVSVPVHCPLMEPAGAQLAEALQAAQLVMPAIPVVHNADGAVATDLEDLRAKLLAQLASPVLWTSCVEQMRAQGVDQLVECGPGKVLAGLVKRIDRALEVYNVDSRAGMDAALAALGA
jgi:[acyl-carrier-protein] S-malonyltransferase